MAGKGMKMFRSMMRLLSPTYLTLLTESTMEQVDGQIPEGYLHPPMEQAINGVMFLR